MQQCAHTSCVGCTLFKRRIRTSPRLSIMLSYTSGAHMTFLPQVTVRRGIRLGPVLTWRSQTELIMNMNCRTSSLSPPRHTPPNPSPLNGTSCLRQHAHSSGCFRGNSDRRDGHTIYNPAPHLGYELAYHGLNTLVMGLMTMAHLGSQPFDLKGLWSTDCKERLSGNDCSYLNKPLETETRG